MVTSTEPKDSAAADTDAYNRHTDGQQETKDEKSHDSFSPVQKLYKKDEESKQARETFEVCTLDCLQSLYINTCTRNS